jgi:formamidopyrimidine-DNA glycosylase
MPELPEVETVRQRLEQVLIGNTISQIQVLRDKSFQGQTQKVIGASIQAVSRKAKLLRLQLDNDLNLLIHLKMTGQLIFVSDDVKTGGGHPTADWVRNLPSKHTRVIIEFSDDSKLYFNDMRVFGWMRVLDDEQVLAEFNKYGPDVIDENFTAKYLQKKLANRTIAIKEAMMTNQIVGGIGNIYANEALFEAGIDPRRSAKSLNLDELRRLVTASKQVIRAGLEAGGTTFDGRYVDVDGLAGSYQNQLKVYDKEGEPCPNCQGKIKKIKIGQRGTYFCPQCQN